MKIAGLVIAVLVFAVGVGMLIVWGGLHATSFLFGWPAQITWIHVVAVWFILFIIGGVFRNASNK